MNILKLLLQMQEAETVDLYLPTINEINNELATLINDRVIHHLSQILRQLADDHQMNFEMLKEQYLSPIKEISDEIIREK